MEFVLVLRELAGRWRIVAIGVAVALVAAVFSVYRVDGFGLKPRSLVTRAPAPRYSWIRVLCPRQRRAVVRTARLAGRRLREFHDQPGGARL